MADLFAQYKVAPRQQATAPVDLFQVNNVAPEAPPTSFSMGGLLDAGKSFLAGAGQGAAALYGLPGDVGRMEEKGVQWLADHLGFGDQAKGAIDAYNRNVADYVTPSSGIVNDQIQQNIAQYHEPQTTLGEYARTTGQFLPNAIAPGSLALRAARVLAPAITSESAGQITKGTSAEPYARFGGALVGGILPDATAAFMSASRGVAPPTAQEIRNNAQQAYRASDQAGVSIAAPSLQNMAQDIQGRIEQEGIDAALHPKATAALKVLNDRTAALAGSNSGLSLTQADRLRRVVASALDGAEPSDRRLVHQVLDHFDDYMNNLTPNDLVTGAANAPEALDTLNNARSLWSQQAKAGMLERAMNKAQNSSAWQHNQAGAIQTQFRALANKPEAFNRFSPAERDAILRVVRGTGAENLLRNFGKGNWKNTVLGGIIGFPLGGVGGSAAGAGAATVLSSAAKALADRMTTNSADLASAAVRGGYTGAVPFSMGLATPSMSALSAAQIQRQRPAQIAPMGFPLFEGQQ